MLRASGSSKGGMRGAGEGALKAKEARERKQEWVGDQLWRPPSSFPLPSLASASPSRSPESPGGRRGSSSRALARPLLASIPSAGPRWVRSTGLRESGSQFRPQRVFSSEAKELDQALPAASLAWTWDRQIAALIAPSRDEK